MAKKDTVDAPAQQRSWAPAIIAGLATFLISGAATYLLAEQPTPLDVPLPRPPRPIFVLDKDTAKSSFLKGRITDAWLPMMAPQPDGVPVLKQGYQSELLGFSIGYPYGSETVAFSYDTFSQDNVESQVKVGIDQALAAIKISVPSNEGKTQLEYAKKVIEDALKSGAKPVESPREVELPGGTFATLAYRRSAVDNNYVHRMYFAAAKKRIVVFDFMLRPEVASLGENYATKIMRSFNPGDVLGGAMEKPPKPKPEETQKPEPSEPAKQPN